MNGGTIAPHQAGTQSAMPVHRRHATIVHVMSAAWRIAACLAVLPFLAAAGACGGDDDEDVGSDGSPIPNAAAVSAIPAGAPLIDQDNLAFEPGALTVQQNTTVYLKNSEMAVHTVTIEGKNVSGVMKKDDLLAWIPPGAGTYRVTCDYHPQMRATIAVK